MSALEPFLIIVVLIVVLVILTELVDDSRTKHLKGKTSRIVSSREKQVAYEMPLGMSARPGLSTTVPPDYSPAVADNLEELYDEKKDKE